MARTYKDSEKEVLMAIMERSQGTAPVEISLGFVSESNQCTTGLVLKKAPPAIINMLKEKFPDIGLGVETDGVHIIIFDK